MKSAFQSLVNGLGIAGDPSLADNSVEEFWLRVADRFAVRISWPHEGRCVEFLAWLAGDRDSPKPAEPEVDPGWCGNCFREGETRRLVAWHRPTDVWLAADRIPLHELDSVSFASALEAFADRLQAIERLRTAT